MVNEIILVFLITALALYLFIREKLPVAGTALLVMLILIVTNILTPEEGVSGFSNPATITVLCMFILSEGLQRTGIIHSLGDKLLAFTKKSNLKQMLALTFIVGPLSGFINNTAAVAVMIPMVIRLADQTKTYSSKLLIPLSYIAMAGGTLTILGTSTNILGSDIYRRLGFEAIGLFEITKLGIIVLATTSIYFIIIGRFLLPERKSQNAASDPYEKLEYQTDIVVTEQSPLVNQKVEESDLKKKYNMKIIHIRRKNRIIKRNTAIKPQDVILVNATRDALLRARDAELVEIKADLDYPETGKTKYTIAQFMVTAGSSLLHRTIISINFKERYKAVALGLKRGNELFEKSIEKIQLKTGDILLLRTTIKNLQKMKKSRDLMIIGELPEPFKKDKLWQVIGIISLVVLLAALGIFPIMVSALIGVLLMVIFKVIEFEEGFKSVNWEVIFLLAGVIPLGIAFEKTGAAALIADVIIELTSQYDPIILLAAFYILTTLLTEIMSNNASIILIAPIAVAVAQKLSLNPFAFMVAVMFAASTSFLTPIGYQTNTMVYSAGNYRFKDFLKVGLPLNTILLFVSVYFISRFWGL